MPVAALVFAVIPGSTHLLSPLAQWAEPWRHEFSRSALVSTGVLFAHVMSIVAAGGLSFAADRDLLFPVPHHAHHAVAWLHNRLAHRRVAIMSLVMALVSGAALFLSDVDVFLKMTTFWLKLGLVVLLIFNAICANRHDTLLARHLDGADDTTPPRDSVCRTYAWLSVTLWVATVLVGTALNAG